MNGLFDQCESLILKDVVTSQTPVVSMTTRLISMVLITLIDIKDQGKM